MAYTRLQKEYCLTYIFIFKFQLHLANPSKFTHPKYISAKRELKSYFKWLVLSKFFVICYMKSVNNFRISDTLETKNIGHHGNKGLKFISFRYSPFCLADSKRCLPEVSVYQD